MAKKDYHGITSGNYWERQRGETPKGYQAFSVYRDLGPKRSLKAAAKALGKCVRLLQGWSTKHHWQERALSFDEYVIENQVESDNIVRRAMLERHTSFNMALQSKLAQRLEQLRPEEISPGLLCYALDMVQRLERLSRGLPDQEQMGTKVEFVVHAPTEPEPKDPDKPDQSDPHKLADKLVN
jgi:hypothetical protein